MSSDELSLFSYEILGLVGRDGAGAHDLLRMARRGRILDWAGESQYYTEPKRLAGLGYLEAHSEPGRTRAHRRGDALLVPSGDAEPALERWYRRMARAEVVPRLDDAVAALGASCLRRWTISRAVARPCSSR